MNWIQNVSGIAIEKMPKVISPKGHAIADYLVAAGAFAAAFAFFKSKNKPAAVAALIAGAATTANALVTDYPGGLFKLVSFPVHGRVDVGTTSLVATLPKLMGFHGDADSRFFYAHAGASLVVVSMTDFGGDGAQRVVEGKD